MNKYYGLSIRQPWASLIIMGLKSVEIRSWSTPYRGRLYIHVSKTVDNEARRRFAIDFKATGVIIGSVDLVDISPFTDETWYSLADEHLQLGPPRRDLFAWFVQNPRALQWNVPCAGHLGLFEIPFECVKQIEKTDK